jgi:hypothetical protein
MTKPSPWQVPTSWCELEKYKLPPAQKNGDGHNNKNTWTNARTTSCYYMLDESKKSTNTVRAPSIPKTVSNNREYSDSTNEAKNTEPRIEKPCK